jgi:hypothetical protein
MSFLPNILFNRCSENVPGYDRRYDIEQGKHIRDRKGNNTENNRKH